MGAGGIELGAAFGPPCFFWRDVEGAWVGQARGLEREESGSPKSRGSHENWKNPGTLSCFSYVMEGAREGAREQIYYFQ